MGTVNRPIEMSIGISNPSAALQPLSGPWPPCFSVFCSSALSSIPTVTRPSGRRPPFLLLTFPLAFYYEISSQETSFLGPLIFHSYTVTRSFQSFDFNILVFSQYKNISPNPHLVLKICFRMRKDRDLEFVISGVARNFGARSEKLQWRPYQKL